MLADWTISQTVAATDLPLTPDEIKRNLNLPLEQAHHDAKLYSYIRGGTAKFELDTNRVCLEQTLAMALDYLPRTEHIDIYKRPVTAIEAITYLDSDGVEQTVDPSVYQISNNRRRVIVAYGQQWPEHQVWAESVKVIFQAGHKTRAEVPELWKIGISLAVGGWFIDPADQAQRDQWRTAYMNLIQRLMEEREY